MAIILFLVFYMDCRELMIQEIEAYFQHHPKWQTLMTELHQIVVDCQLIETIKWRVPCYTWQGKNICLISALKNHCALSFPKGALLQDPERILEVPGPNSHSARLIRFSDLASIDRLRRPLKKWIVQAIELEEAGVKVRSADRPTSERPAELDSVFQNDPELRLAFDQLTPGRQRGYLLHFNGAKQSTTRLKRVQDCRDRILAGRGLRDCICGLSQRMPNCDGSHKNGGPN